MACICWLPPEQWDTSYYGIAEPGSQMEWDPDCPVHGNRDRMTRRDRLTLAVVAVCTMLLFWHARDILAGVAWAAGYR